MNKEFKVTDDLLLDFIDGGLDSSQHKMVEDALESDIMLQLRLEELQNLDIVLSSGDIVQPSKNFTQNVMAGLDKPGTQSYTPGKNAFIILALGLITVLLGSFTLSGVLPEFNLSIGNLPDIEGFAFPDISRSISLSLESIVYGLLFVLSILSLLFLDRLVLKPYFHNRRTKIQY